MQHRHFHSVSSLVKWYGSGGSSFENSQSEKADFSVSEESWLVSVNLGALGSARGIGAAHFWVCHGGHGGVALGSESGPCPLCPCHCSPALFPGPLSKQLCSTRPFCLDAPALKPAGRGIKTCEMGNQMQPLL